MMLAKSGRSNLRGKKNGCIIISHDIYDWGNEYHYIPLQRQLAVILFLDIAVMVINSWQGFITRKPFKIIIWIYKAKKVKKQNHWTFSTLGHLQGRILQHLLIQQWKPSLNRQVHCFNAILFPLGITFLLNIKYPISGWVLPTLKMT